MHDKPVDFGRRAFVNELGHQQVDIQESGKSGSEEDEGDVASMRVLRGIDIGGGINVSNSTSVLGNSSKAEGHGYKGESKHNNANESGLFHFNKI